MPMQHSLSALCLQMVEDDALDPRLELRALPQHEGPVIATQQHSDSLPCLQGCRVNSLQPFLTP